MVGLRAEFSSGMLRAVAWLRVERMTTMSFMVRDRPELWSPTQWNNDSSRQQLLTAALVRRGPHG